MLESEREFIRDLRAQFHDDRVADVDMEKALAQRKDYETWKKVHELKEYQEKAKIERYRRGEYTPQERQASEEAIKEMLKPIEEQIKANRAKTAQLYDGLNKQPMNQEGREQIERLLEITQDKNDYLTARIEEATAQGNEVLLERYTQEKADNDKDLELYRGKYEAYKAAAEG